MDDRRRRRLVGAVSCALRGAVNTGLKFTEMQGMIAYSRWNHHRP